jgi:hypothetical protein
MKGVNAISFNRERTRLFFSLVFWRRALRADLTGKAPRLVVDKVGGLNAFQVGDDGMIYGPLMFKGQIANRSDTGAVTTVASGHVEPGALSSTARATRTCSTTRTSV